MVDALRNPQITEFYANSPILDLSIQIDGFFEDVAGLYVYPNWFKGEIVAGPYVKRYWVSVVLKFDEQTMPDPDGGAVLVNLGCKVFYKKYKERVSVKVKDPNDLDRRGRPKMETKKCWLVKVVIPRKYFEMKNFGNLELVDDDIDTEALENSINM